MSALLTFSTYNDTPWPCGIATSAETFVSVPPCTDTTACSPLSIPLTSATSLSVAVNNGVVLTLPVTTTISAAPIAFTGSTAVFGYVSLQPSSTALNTYILNICANAVTVAPPNLPEGTQNWLGQSVVKLTINDGSLTVKTAADGTQFAWPVAVGDVITLNTTYTSYGCLCGNECVLSKNATYELQGEPATFSFPDLLTWFRSGTNPEPVYIDANYADINATTANRSILHALGTITQSLLSITFPEWGNLGFTWGVLGQTLYSGPAFDFTTTPVVPGAVFNIMNPNAISTQTEALTISILNGVINMYYAPLDLSNQALLPLQCFTFLLNSIGSLILCVINPFASNGVQAIQLAYSGDPTQNATVSLVNPELCTYQYGVVPLWNDSARQAQGLLLLAREIIENTSSSANYGSTWFRLNQIGQFTANVDNATLSFTPPSFVRPWCANPFVEPGGVFLQLAPCLVDISPAYTSLYGCDSDAACVLNKTVAGMATCGCNPTSSADIAAAKNYLTELCYVPYVSAQCGDVAGTPTSSCTGFSLPGLSEACQAARTAVIQAEDNSNFIETANQNFCSNPAFANMGDCACINVQTSSFPALNENKLSFPGAQAALFNEFGLSGVVQLRPECFWPTCDAGGAGLQHVPTYFSSHCPQGITTCETEVMNVISNNSKVNVNIVQDCGYNTSSMLACSPTIFDQFAKYGRPLSNSSTTTSSGTADVLTVLSTLDYVLLSVVGVLSLLFIALSIWLGVKYAKLRGAA